MNHKMTNAERLRAEEAKWRAEMQARKFEDAVERGVFNAAVRAEVKRRTSPAPPRTQRPHVAARLTLGTLVLLARIVRFVVVGTLVAFVSVLLGIIGASRHR